MESLVNFETNGMIVANFWAVLLFPASVYGSGPATLRRGIKRQNLTLLAWILESSLEFRSNWDEVGYHGFVRTVDKAWILIMMNYEIGPSAKKMGDRRPCVHLIPWII